MMRLFRFAPLVLIFLIEGCGSSEAASDNVTDASVDTVASDASDAKADQAELPDAVDAADTDAPVLTDASDAGPDAPVGTFPSNFAFGTAIAGFQVDMGCPTIAAAICEDRNSDWYQWITTQRILDNPILYMSKDPPSSGPGFYELWAQDLDRASGTGPEQLGTKVLRLSIEWSRLFPKATFGISGYDNLKKAANPEALKFYHDLLNGLAARGVRPSVTVNHYTLPLWIHDGDMCNDGKIPGQSLANCIAAGKGGWADPNRNRIVDEIAKYAGFVGKEFGDKIDEWATLNEPFSAVIVPGYLMATEMRSAPPGLSGLWMSVSGAKTAYLAMIEAHARMYDALKAADTVDADGDGSAAKVGIVYSFSKIVPSSPSAGDLKAAASAEYFFHDMFMDGIAFGRVDPNWDKGPGQGETRADLQNRLDWVGVNYYFQFPAQSSVVSTLPFISSLIDFNMLQSFDGEAPGGIYDVLKRAQRYEKPLIVTETGMAQDDEHKGAAWFVQTLNETRHAINDGVDVRGFYAWTLTDNYEWNHGMKIRLGLYKLLDSKERSLREAGKVYGTMVKARDVPSELLTEYQGIFNH